MFTSAPPPKPTLDDLIAPLASGPDSSSTLESRSPPPYTPVIHISSVDLPPSYYVEGCNLVYKIKTHADGMIVCYKAQFIAKGYKQEYNIDYEETFAPVARLKSIRDLIAVASTQDWSLFRWT
ncbi:hypothetical protein RJ640_009970 [Escallonia rubra]|uniref:Reverse transcriptase Ty1/copia-type domain-containing protein n=1 Tax=Escallonia rubra TaxID=112253 RepID=A0AA88R070_9ASTE|nr:hypothetical protein RJ640_009970 [Escallonia rubra]